MSKFEEMIAYHKQAVANQFKIISNYLEAKATVHDNDKIEPGMINDVYNEHFPTLKSIDYGTEEYVAYEKQYFSKAHFEHAQNRHHYYNPNNNLTDIDLFDVIEAIVDIRQSQIQYSDYDIDRIMNTFKTKGVLDLDLEDLARNTLIKLEELDENQV